MGCVNYCPYSQSRPEMGSGSYGNIMLKTIKSYCLCAEASANKFYFFMFVILLWYIHNENKLLST
jgi:hypothetical protein